MTRKQGRFADWGHRGSRLARAVEGGAGGRSLREKEHC
jgi:hypothetical protein